MSNAADIAVADLLDWARWYLHLTTDRELAHHLAMTAPALSKARRGRLALGPALLVRVLEATDTSMKRLPADIAEFVASRQEGVG